MKTLLDAGGKIDGTHQRGETALFVAAFFGAKGAAQVLVDAGANRSASNTKGTKPSEAACSCQLESEGSSTACFGGRCASEADKTAMIAILEVFHVLLFGFL